MAAPKQNAYAASRLESATHNEPITPMVGTSMQNERVLLLPAAAALEALLSDAGFSCLACHDPTALSEELERGAGVIILTADVLAEGIAAPLYAAIDRQPSWSDLPVVLLCSADVVRRIDAALIEPLGNVIVQPSPCEPNSLISVLRAALRARRRQLAVREQLESLRRMEAARQLADAARKRTESELSASEARFHALAGDIPSIVHNAQEQLLETDRRKDQFLAILAHELRNPLMPIRSGLEVLAMTETQHSEIVELMQQQTVHLARLVDDLLDVSRIVCGRIELRKEPVELRAIVDRSVAAVSSSLEAKNQTLSISLPPDSIWLNADPIRLVQVVENLLSNASKYTDNRGRVALSVQTSEGQVELTVHDNGIGIDPELLPGLFDLFSQAASSIERSQGGLGIGLTLVKSLVELHGGTVEAASSGRGQGSQFIVRLAVAPDVSAMPQPPEQVPDTLPGRRILVVDDNPGAVKALSLLLSKMGPHEVAMATNGIEALEQIRRLRPELVLLDIGLPGMNGYEVARAVRADPELEEILLAAVTGYGRREDRQESAAAGFDRHLVKPFAMRELADLLVHPKLARRNCHARIARQPADSAVAPSDANDVADRVVEERPSLRNLVHDLRNHLYVMKTILEIHRKNSSDTSPAAQAGLIARIDAEVQSLGRTIETLKRIATKSAPSA
jgi:signal transduction histidine kinase